MKKIDVKVPQNNYPVFIGTNYITGLPGLITERNLPENIFFVIDSKVNVCHRRQIEKLKKSFKGRYDQYILTANETNKRLATVDKIYSKLLKKNFGRDALLVAIGGGVTGDIVGFTAATYLRGVLYIQVPTTILAAADSSVGGKTGVNFNNYKNQIGAFYQPKAVFIDTAFFKTLPEEEVICGFGEIIKYAYLIDNKFYNYVNRLSRKINKPAQKDIIELVSTSVKFKGGVVVSDEKESGLRKILNLGHTFAHAIEYVEDFKIKHGQAVIVGLACSFYLSNKLGLITNKQLNEYLKLPLNLKKYIALKKIKKENIYKAMFADKKNRYGNIRFVLLKDVGKILVDVEAKKQDVTFAIEKGIQHFK